MTKISLFLSCSSCFFSFLISPHFSLNLCLYLYLALSFSVFYSIYSAEIQFERKIKSRYIIRFHPSLVHERVHACNGLSEIKTEIEGNTRHQPTLTKSISVAEYEHRSLNYGNCTSIIIIIVVSCSCRHSYRIIGLGGHTAEMHICRSEGFNPEAY